MVKGKQLLTTKDVAEYLNVHIITVRRHLESGKLKGFKVGTRWRIRKGDLQEYLKGQ